MFKSIGEQVCAFDLEWVPDPQSGRQVYGLPATLPDAETFEVMWTQGGAIPDKPRPYLKTVLCRVVAVSAVIREQRQGEVHLQLTTLPKQADQPLDEGELISTFLAYLGQQKPQLVGYNSQTTDLPILLQRGIAAGISAPEFCRRPDRSWAGHDYFARHGDAHIDLKQTLSGWGIGTPPLAELAAIMGIPGRVGLGEEGSVVDWWVAGNLSAIVQQSQYDALTTYLVWLRTARFAGFFSHQQYSEEEERVRAMVRDRISQGDRHLGLYLAQWEQMQAPKANSTLRQQ